MLRYLKTLRSRWLWLPLLAGTITTAALPAYAGFDVPVPSTVTGTVQKLDFAAGHFDLRQSNGRTYRVNAPRAGVWLNGRAVGFAGLHNGETVRVHAHAFSLGDKGLDTNRIEIPNNGALWSSFGTHHTSSNHHH